MSGIIYVITLCFESYLFSQAAAIKASRIVEAKKCAVAPEMYFLSNSLPHL